MSNWIWNSSKYIYKLVKLGSKNSKWLFINISDTGGYGTATEWDEWSNFEADCIIGIINSGSLIDTKNKIIIGSLNEALEVAGSFELLLDATLPKNAKISN